MQRDNKKSNNLLSGTMPIIVPLIVPLLSHTQQAKSQHDTTLLGQWDNKIPLKQNLIFPQAGKYTFTFEQGMRTNPLPLVMDFGMTVELAK